MLYSTLFLIIITLTLFYYFKIVYRNIKNYELHVKKRNDELSKIISDHELIVKNFDDYYQNKNFQIGLSFIQLKYYQLDLIELLDSSVDSHMINQLKKNVNEIENLLKEISFLAKFSGKKSVSKKGTIIEKIFFDESKFSKN